MILNEGELMYHGPVTAVENYFESLGFERPDDRDLADYLLDLGTSNQYKYQKESPGSGLPPPRLASEFAERFRMSAIFDQNLHALATPHRPELLRNADEHMMKMPMFHQSFWQSTMTLFRRQLMVTYRNKPFIVGRLIMIVVMGLLYGTTFYQFDPTQISVVMGVIYAGVMFLSLGQASQIPTYMAERDIFYKQRGANFYRTGSYVLANSISQFPLALAETIIFGSIIYWVCGFEASFERFIVFEVILYVTTLCMGMWFLFITASCPNTSVATPSGMLTVLLFMIFAGFIVTKDQIPDYLIWIHWISPMSWALKALAINEYRSNSLDVCEYGGVNYCSEYGMRAGEYYTSLFGVDTEKTWVVYGIIYNACLYVVFLFITYLMLEFNRYESPENVDTTKSEVEDVSEVYKLAETPRAVQAGSGEAIEHAITVRSHQKNFVPVTVAFRNLRYFVPDPSNPKESLELLKGISGFAKPGSITALMGSSGAGKTTLMDVIAGRKTEGKITGEILLNGYPATDLSIRRCTGYCEQMDIHSEAATIREALTFSSFLRQDSSIPDSAKFDSVEECLDLLGLRSIAERIIRGSSVEQMKRLTIGVELAAQPSVLFLDEPTSGLDARSAKLIMDGVRKVADSGRTIVCTIHQPSADVFELFDSLLLLKRGGETVFFGELGEESQQMISYFESIPGVSPLPDDYNPATWMLECIGAGVNNSSANAIDFVKIFTESSHYRQLEESLNESGVTKPSIDHPEIVFGDKRAARSTTQMTFLVQRFFRMYWRTPTYNLTRLCTAIFLALLFGIIFVDAEYDSYTGLNSGVGMVFMAAFFNGLISYQSILPLTSEERASFYRERASQTYNAFWYFFASVMVEIPYVAASAFVFTIIFYPMVGFTDFKAGVLFWVCESLIILMSTTMGQMFAYALPGEEVANIIGMLINSVFSLYMGFSPPAYAIPAGYKWLYTIAPTRFPLAILIALVFADCDELPTWDSSLQQYVNIGSQLGCQPMKNSPETVGHITLKEYTEEYFKMKHSEIPQNFAITAAYIVLYLLLSLLALRYVNHQKK